MACFTQYLDSSGGKNNYVIVAKLFRKDEHSLLLKRNSSYFLVYEGKDNLVTAGRDDWCGYSCNCFHITVNSLFNKTPTLKKRGWLFWVTDVIVIIYLSLVFNKTPTLEKRGWLFWL